MWYFLQVNGNLVQTSVVWYGVIRTFHRLNAPLASQICLCLNPPQMLFLFISAISSTAGGDLSMLFHYMPVLSLPFHAGSVRKGYYISYDTICNLPWISPLSRFTGHRHLLPIDFHSFFSHVLATTVAPPIGHLETISCCVSLLGGSAIRCQWYSLDPPSI